ncbi:MAG: hypothetical protein IJT91_05145 [Clostridia bacterium]|nr:hypothetical protein [Clostridia bacterium]
MICLSEKKPILLLPAACLLPACAPVLFALGSPFGLMFNAAFSLSATHCG